MLNITRCAKHHGLVQWRVAERCSLPWPSFTSSGSGKGEIMRWAKARERVRGAQSFDQHCMTLESDEVMLNIDLAF
jgi:hypothetical protein